MVDLGLRDSYLCVMLRPLLILLFAIMLSVVRPLLAEQVSGERPAESMIYQYAGVSLVVKIDVPETDFISTIYGSDDTLVSSAGIPLERIGPVFLFIPASEIPRQLMITVKPARAIDRSRINLELIQLSGRDRLSEVSAQAYQLFSQGNSLAHSNDTTTWAMKAYTLRNAAEAFAKLGWEEMRLWGDFYAAHLALVKLNDLVTAMDFAREIQVQAKRAGFLEIELAAAILEADALQKAGSNPSGRIAAARLEQAHRALDRVATLAGRLGMRSEQARALFNNGLVYQKQENLDAAVRQFQAALDVSLVSDDQDLVNEIRSTAAAVYETQGAMSGAIEMLDDIGSDLESDAGQQLTDTLFEKGRILNSTYRYPEAAEELHQALELQKADPVVAQWGPTGLALAWALYSMGDMEGASSLVEESIPRTPLRRNSDALLRAYESLANLNRGQQQYELMDLYRGKQGELSRSDRKRTRFLFESGLDAWSRDGSGSREARDQLAASRRMALASGDKLLAYRAAMNLCLLRAEDEGRGACALADVRSAYDALRNSGIPRLAMDAGLLGVKILYREGSYREAHAKVQNLIREVLFYRQALNGVLGAWYWNNRVSILQAYMDITLARSGGFGGVESDGRQVLLALDHIRLINAGDAWGVATAVVGEEEDEALRSLLARREAAEPVDEPVLTREADTALGELQQTFRPSISPLDGSTLDALLAGLGPDESILTYYFGEAADWVLVASNEGVTMLRLPRSGGLAGSRLAGLNERIGRGGASFLPELDALGRKLAGPVSGMLTNTIYLLPSGPLNGFPFDLLRINGDFLAQRHEVVNLATLASVANRPLRLAPDFSQHVFLAGNPQQDQELFSYDLPLSVEITSLTDRFVGPGLHIVQGVALREDEFQDPRFFQARLVHLSTPGSIDLAYPARSVLKMSRGGDSGPSDDLTPAEISTLSIGAELVVLSRTAASGISRSGTDSRLGLVSDFLDAGAGSVLASMWPGGDAGTAAFMDEFYGNLGPDLDVSKALSRARRERMESANEGNFRSWAGFQLHIR